MSRVIVVSCRKGGVGKSTTAVNLSYELSKLNKKVLVLDLDGQSDTSKFYSRTEEDYYIGDALLDHKFDVTKAIYPVIVRGESMSNLHIIPARADDSMTKLSMDMFSLAKREERLKRHLDKIMDDYDFVIIDTNPNSDILFRNAVNSATEYLITSTYTEHSLDGIDAMLEHIQSAVLIDEEDINFLVVPTKVNKASKRAIAYGETYLSSSWPNNVSKTVIYERAIFTEAEAAHEPLSAFKSGDVAAMYYKNLAKEVLERE